MTKLFTTLYLIIGECPTHVNKAFLDMLYYKKRKQEKKQTKGREGEKTPRD